MDIMMGKKEVEAFEQTVFSWSLDDIQNQDLYKHQVEKIPLTFESEEHYFGSFVYPLLEETRADLASAMEIMYRAPYAEIFSLGKAKGHGKLLYDVTVGNWKNKYSERGKETYRTLPGDLLILADRKPESVHDLQRAGRMWAFSLVYKISDSEDADHDSISASFRIKASEQIEFQEGMFVVFLMNSTTNQRIWSSLHMHQNMNIIKEILYTDLMVKERCNICSFDIDVFQRFDPLFLDQLNESQRGAIKEVIRKTKCCHGSFVEQIWGPPGTGKTTTVSVLLFILFQMKRRTLTCAPTNVGVVRVASRVLNLVKESTNTTTASGDVFYCIGDLLLFGNKQRLKIDEEDIEEIYLEKRVERLTECFGSFTGWKHCLRSVIDLLEDSVSHYHVFLENAVENQNETKAASKLETKSLLEFLHDRFSSCVLPLRRCIFTFLTHIPKSLLTENNFQKMVSVLDDLTSFESLLLEENLVSEELEQIFSSAPQQNDSKKMLSINLVRAKIVDVLKALLMSLEGLGLPSVLNRFAIMDFCFQNASLIFCTTSTSYKLHTVKVKPLEILVIDEAAQLKEAESTIPLQLLGMKHAILIGDECQLPAMVSSNVCIEAGFGRSLFGRLSSLGHSKHLLKNELDQLNDLINGNSVLFKDEKWKVLFSDDFKRSFGKLISTRLKKLVLNLLLKLSAGWRPKSKSVDVFCETSSQILKKFKVEGLYIICSVDIVKEVEYKQVLKVWDVLPLEEITKLTKRLESIFSAYTANYIKLCTSKCLEGNFEVPRSWPASQEIIRFRSLSNCDCENEASVNPGDGGVYVENSKVSESLLLMKFYSLSRGVVSHLLSGKEIYLPMHVTDEQMDVIVFSKSSFIIGRSGTGKTTILTSKLFQNEQNFRVACKGTNEAENSQIRDVEVDDSGNRKPNVIRQLFVTVSPKLCYAVKQHLSQLTSISCQGNSSAELNLDDADATSELDDIPDTFIDIPVKKYPLVLTFHKLLMMLDNTLGSSYFERFSEAREGIYGNHIALQSFIRLKEVTFDRFCSLYWPHFNDNHKKGLDTSRVFTEIISHIKGGLLAGECIDGKLSFEDYCLLAESRISTLTKQERENVYSIFQAYEKVKTQRGEFDLGDLVIDLLHRFKNVTYTGDQMDFIYIDEVQDLSMRQISLFKFICQNVDEGFVFAGDTAQTIARGIDFRFQDIRTLFYNEFLTSRTLGKPEKGLVSEIFQLKQNFRTHAGVLDLAHSVIQILYCYFRHSVDILEPETSLISGEAPVLLESGNDENAIVTILGGSGSGAEIVGFGAEQVILVRDDIAKNEICELIGKQALVLTIVECKGLEFQDVLLYNFFGTSPLKDQWRVIYGYMKERDWLDEIHITSFPSFSESRHSVLCSELKQLYVAITRTRQRLWICENKEELSKPMFDYWKRRGLVQVRKVDDSLAQAMRVASSPEEWRDRGKKLFYDNNFVMATMCFERAGDKMWGTLAEACGLRASADQLRAKNHKAFLRGVRKAAGMFESIRKLELAASCYCDLGEYEKAGKIYMIKCGKMDAAAECFTLAGCYSDAAEAYAKGDKFSECLSVCRKGKLYDEGLRYIEQWKEHCNVQSKEIEVVEQEFLESCARYYHKSKDFISMMKFVRAFCSMESKRVFLRSLGCLDDLLILEEESGYFLDAAELARSWGDVLKEADLLEKAGDFLEATILILWFVFFSSLWENGNTGWPLKQFAQREELCEKAKSLAKSYASDFYDFVCRELNLLYYQQGSLLELRKCFHAPREYMIYRVEISLVRNILDCHTRLNVSKYEWENELSVDITKHCRDNISHNQVSVRTITFYWNVWKNYILDIFKSFESFDREELYEHMAHVDFLLNYFGVRKHCVNGNIIYVLVNENVEWIKKGGQKGLHREGKLLSIDIKDLVYSMRSYWQSELVSVGIKVLETLEGLHKSKLNGSAFHQSISLLQIYEVSKSLLDCQYVKTKDMKKLERFLKTSLTYFDLVFPLDWRKSISENLISLRETNSSLSLLTEIINQDLNMKGDITYWTIGRVMMICLGSRKYLALYKHILKRVQSKPAWKLFLDVYMDESSNEDCAQALLCALRHTFNANWRCAGYISPHSFVFLLEKLLYLASFSKRNHFMTKSSFVGWLTHSHSTILSYTAPTDVYTNHAFGFIVHKIQQILCNKSDTIAWIRSSNIMFSDYHPLLSLKLVMILCLICLKASDCSPLLLDVLNGRNNIAYLLPKKFVSDILRRRNGDCLNLNPDMVAEAFMSVDDSLLIVCSEDAGLKIHAPSAIFVDPRKSKEEIMSLLFPRKTVISVESRSKDDAGKILEASSSNTLLDEKPSVSLVEPRMNWKVLEDILEGINGKEGVLLSSLSSAAMIKKGLDKNIDILATALADKSLCASIHATVVDGAAFAIDALKRLKSLFGKEIYEDPCNDLEHFSSTCGFSIQTWERSIGMMIVEQLQSDRPNIEAFLSHSAMRRELKTEQVVVSPNRSTTEVEQTSDDNYHGKGICDDDSVVLEKQSGGCNTQDAKNKKSKPKKNKKSKGRKK